MHHIEQIQSSYHTCDICFNRVRTQWCPGCGRDICQGCSVDYEKDPWTNEPYNNANMEFICSTCSEIGAILMSKAHEIRMNANAQIAALNTEWINRCKPIQGPLNDSTN